MVHAIEPVIDAQLANTDYDVQSVSVDADTAMLVITGSGQRPDLAGLPDRVKAETGRALSFEIRVVPTERMRATVSPEAP